MLDAMVAAHEREPMVGAEENSYRTPGGFTMTREKDSLTPNGNPVAGHWVLRDPAGAFVDYDQYRHDLISRNGFRMAY